MNYYLPQSLSNKQLRIAVVGVGGTGGEVINALTRLNFGLKALSGNNEAGIHVTAFDNDLVEPHNIGRQPYSLSDVGQYKSLTLIHRCNMFYGTSWQATPAHFDPKKEDLSNFDIVIGCVDKAEFRATLGKVAQDSSHQFFKSSCLWLDFGNGQHSGQCVLGHLRTTKEDNLRLPTIFDLYPDLASPSHDADDSAPRCSLAQALQHQDLFINSSLATMGMNILWELLTKGVIAHHGLQVDTKSLRTTPMMIDKDTWDFYGYSQAKAVA